MNYYCHIDFIGPQKYRVRVTEQTPIVTTDHKGREEVTGHVNGNELLRFEHTSEKYGGRLRREIEEIAARKVQEAGK